MVKQVQEILPRVPAQVIVADLVRTRSVDVTVTNILEGVVKYEELPDQPQSSSSTAATIKKVCIFLYIKHK